jgi:hypothetical protein
MRLWLVLASFLMVMGLSAAKAADAGVGHKSSVAAAATVYRVIPRSPEASLVWASDACWRGCAHDCGHHFKACISAGEGCVTENNACDRYCQRECRTYGGPLLPIDW